MNYYRNNRNFLNDGSITRIEAIYIGTPWLVVSDRFWFGLSNFTSLVSSSNCLPSLTCSMLLARLIGLVIRHWMHPTDYRPWLCPPKLTNRCGESAWCVIVEFMAVDLIKELRDGFNRIQTDCFVRVKHQILVKIPSSPAQCLSGSETFRFQSLSKVSRSCFLRSSW